MCVPLTFACFFAALVPYKRNGGAGAVQQQPGIHSSNIIPNSATDYTCCCCCCCQCRSSFADRDYIKRTLPHSDDATRTTHHVPMRHKYFAKLGGWLLGGGREDEQEDRRVVVYKDEGWSLLSVYGHVSVSPCVVVWLNISTLRCHKYTVHVL